ncbi:hypothetical protein JTE90_009896 [Oedothorax gibbosus]|uniref:Uncharacterized protein n=1 Tax=Oedothorax gibbosus TaxID=931172 RepID=A0AAV6UUL6_9ARAC|nr:hypothetical protein JTE90_009896 [Oedothorax gibbosus]
MHWITGVLTLVLCICMVHCKPCQNESDCAPGECCAKMMLHYDSGRCLRLGKEQSACNMVEEKKDGKYLRACPCCKGYTCTPKRGHNEIVIADFAIFLLRCQKTVHSEDGPTNMTTVSASEEKAMEEFVYEYDAAIDDHEAAKNKTKLKRKVKKH